MTKAWNLRRSTDLLNCTEELRGVNLHTPAVVCTSGLDTNEKHVVNKLRHSGKLYNRFPDIAIFKQMSLKSAYSKSLIHLAWLNGIKNELNMISSCPVWGFSRLHLIIIFITDLFIHSLYTQSLFQLYEKCQAWDQKRAQGHVSLLPDNLIYQ